MKVLQTHLYVLQVITVWQTLSTQHSALAYLELTHQLGFLVSELWTQTASPVTPGNTVLLQAFLRYLVPAQQVIIARR